MSRSGELLLLSRRDYDAAGVDSAIRAVFEHFGGIDRFVRPGSRVLLKVNLVAGHPPERRVTTDPEIVRAVARQVLSAGGWPFIADSPGIDAFVPAAEDALALDLRLCRMMGASLEDFPLWLAAKKRGLPQCGPNGSTIAGDFPPSHIFTGTDIPAPRSLRLLPRLPFSRLWERALTSRPVHVPSLCIGCGRCEAVCAAGALKHADRTVRFDYRKCIRCYCCHEMCPVRAIAFRESPLVRLLRRAEDLASRLRGR